jgi:ribosomal protein L28
MCVRRVRRPGDAGLRLFPGLREGAVRAREVRAAGNCGRLRSGASAAYQRFASKRKVSGRVWGPTLQWARSVRASKTIKLCANALSPQAMTKASGVAPPMKTLPRQTTLCES